MKTTASIALLGLLLAGCSASADSKGGSEPTDAAKVADVTTANATATDRSGDYDVTAADGTKWHTKIGKDGTYSAAYADGKQEKGTVVDSDGQTCFDKDGDGSPRCWTLSDPRATGTFTATDGRGEKVSVVRSDG